MSEYVTKKTKRKFVNFYEDWNVAYSWKTRPENINNRIDSKSSSVYLYSECSYRHTENTLRLDYCFTNGHWDIQPQKKEELQTHFMMHTIKSWVFEPSEWWSSCIRFRLIFTHLFISAYICCCVDSINVIDLTLWNVNQYKFIMRSLCKQSVVDVYPCEYRQ